MMLSNFSELSHSIAVNSVILLQCSAVLLQFHSFYDFCQSFSRSCQIFCYSAQLFYNFVSHSRDLVNHVAIVHIQFVKIP
jgi:hypothetical protein